MAVKNIGTPSPPYKRAYSLENKRLEIVSPITLMLSTCGNQSVSAFMDSGTHSRVFYSSNQVPLECLPLEQDTNVLSARNRSCKQRPGMSGDHQTQMPDPVSQNSPPTQRNLALQETFRKSYKK